MLSDIGNWIRGQEVICSMWAIVVKVPGKSLTYMMSRPVLKSSVFLTFCCLYLLVACAPTGIYHTVQPGQTLYRIAKTYNVDEKQLARLNNIKDPKQLKAKQRLYIPGATQQRKVPVSSSKTSTYSPARTSTPPPKPEQKTATNRVSKPAVKKPAKSNNSTVAKPAKGLFIWPVKGKVLNNFGKQGKNIYKGIEIGVPKGTAVAAAASGKVIYSGSAISGYGNLVILEHSDSYFSVYGFNQKALVKMDDHVGQGEKIALSGSPPNGQSPRLHFEIRKGKSAVNPILYLP